MSMITCVWRFLQVNQHLKYESDVTDCENTMKPLLYVKEVYLLGCDVSILCAVIKREP